MINRARQYATAAHQWHFRKYTGEPYTNHLREVAFLVELVGGDDEMIAAAWLHDTVEDTHVTVEDIQEVFGQRVANLVGELTDVSKPEDGNRRVRKELDRQHLDKASPDAQTIKLADLISNTVSIVKEDPSFAKVYLDEKRALLACLLDGDVDLWRMAFRIWRKSSP